MCDNHSSTKRHGSKLEHGKAHKKDHQKWTRRSFLASLGIGVLGSGMNLGGLSINAMARSKFLNRLVEADNDRVLILIQLSGGNDGLNTVIPFTNDIYYQKRPTIAISKQQSIQLNDDLGIHPSMSSIEPFWGEGELAIINNVGYENTNRSHARATDIWTTASGADQNSTSGWAGRYLIEDNPDFIINPPEFPLGVRIGGSATLFQSEFGNLGVTFGGASQFGQFLEQGGFYDQDNVPANEFGRSLSFARKIANSSFRYLESIQNAADQSGNFGEYPNSGLSRSLSVIARLIRGGLKTKVFLVSKGGFDTHNNQGGKDGGHANLLSDIADSVNAFYTDLKSDNLQDRALTMTFSEFGRTLDENSSNGTDHGSSAPVMAFGPVNGGIFGEHANLTDLDNQGDPIYKQDYRSIYRSILEDWFELETQESTTVLSGDFEKIDFVDSLAVSNEDMNNSTPRSFRLEQNYPNPFNPVTTIGFKIAKAGDVRLQVYDIRGQLISTLINKRLSAGDHKIVFDATSLASGVYLYKLQTKEGVQSKKMTLIK